MTQSGGSDWAGILQIIIALGALGVVIWYTWETRRYRIVSEKTLIQLQVQYEKSYDCHIAPVQWQGSYQIQIANLGPGPAKDITVRALQDPKVRRCLQGEWFGLPAGEKRVVDLKDCPEFVDIGEWPGWVVPSYMYVEIGSKTVLQKEVRSGKLMVGATNVALV